MPTARARLTSGSVWLLLTVLLSAVPFARASEARTGPSRPDWSPILVTTLAWHDNATNGERPSDILSAAQWLTELSGSHRLLLGRNDSLLLVGRVGTEVWPRFDGLDRASPGVRAILQHKFALGAYAPTLRLEASGDLVLARESERGGRAGTIGLHFRQRFHSTLVLQLGHERARYDARALAFDRTGHETTGRLAWQLGSAWQVDFAVSQRDGTVLSYSVPPRPDLVASGKKIVLVDTFARSTPLIAYYFPARTRSVEIHASRTLARGTSLTLAAIERETRHGVSSSYRNRIYSVALARAF